MSDYTPPLRDIEFALHHIAGINDLVSLPAFDHIEPDMISGVLDEAGRFMAEVIAPTLRVGDTTGATFADGNVTTPDEFHKAWGLYVQAGWNAVDGAVEYGGHGFPGVVGLAVKEMLVTANMALSLNPMLTGSAISLLEKHGSDEQRATYLENLITAQWTGTMVLTEPEAGSDLGQIRARAERADDGTYRLSGSKIFITWGDHDLADNIVHLVLARTPDAPPGTRGMSLFIVPKFIVEDDGSPGARNGVDCVSIEHKLGIHGSPTCVLSFADATAYLVGEEHHGMRLMFTMMNQARVEVGLEGLAVAERAYQQALTYARERHQGRAAGSASTSPIVDHPDVRRMLVTMKATNEAMRGLLYDTAAAADRADHAVDDSDRDAARARQALLTPVAKAWCTDRSVEMASLGLQVHGGAGYIEETGAAQHYRDARITPIYEGTNGIQSIDLVARKLPMDGGSVVRGYLAEIEALDDALGEAGERFHGLRVNLREALAALTSATEWLLAQDDQSDVLAGSTPYLRMFGTVAGGYYLAREALHAVTEDDDAWRSAKIATAIFYGEQLLPEAKGLQSAVTRGAGQLFALDTAQLEPR